MLDVAVIGSGPAGLATALGMQATLPGVRLMVFDKARQLRPIGAAVTMAGNGQGALRAISPKGYEAVRAIGLAVTGWQNRDHHDTIVRDAPVPPGVKDDQSQLITSWFGLQRALLDTLGREHLELGKSLAKVEQTPGGPVRLTFEDGSQVTAHVVVGADGNMSATRAALFPEEGPPEYTGAAIWRTMVQPVPEDIRLPKGYMALWTSEEGSTRRIGMRNFGDHLSITGIAPWPKERLEELWRRTFYGEDAPSDALARMEDKRSRALGALASGLPKNITSILLNSDPRTLIEHGLYWRDPDNPWVRGSVALVGDAAHVMPPLMGQGTSVAFEDAYWLVARLVEALSAHVEGTGVSPLEALRDQRNTDLINAALNAYQAHQQPRIGLMSRRTMAAEATNTIKVAPTEADVKLLGDKAFGVWLNEAGLLPPLTSRFKHLALELEPLTPDRPALLRA